MHDTDSEWGDADSALVSYFDVLMGDPHTERTGDVDFYVRQASERGGPVLELGCGTGRVLLPIARANVEIDGVDGSSGMLAVLKAKLEHLGRPGNLGRLYRCSMECFTLDRRYNVIICPYIGFQYLLEIGDQLACLRSVRGHLNNDGVFIFDVYDPDVSRLAKSSAGSGSLGPRQVVRLDRDRIVLRDEEIST
ncbi:MAG: class I SAM-dependent methyltransferase, partial [Deltaproteobacteria bacterium]|nr:class I SAM-dependent methyltransferase [Deltaproteobacteria bacterium]